MGFPKAAGLGAEVYYRVYPDRNASAPRYVIAFRGTVLRYLLDVIADIRIRLGNHQSKWVQEIQALVLEVIQKIRCEGGRIEQIRLTGLPLGTEIALLTGIHFKIQARYPQ